MSNNATETMTEQQICHKRNKEKCLKKDRRYFEEDKERIQKIARSNTKDYLKKKKIKKEQRKSRYPNINEKHKQKIKEYTKEYNKSQYQNLSEENKQKKK